MVAAEAEVATAESEQSTREREERPENKHVDRDPRPNGSQGKKDPTDVESALHRTPVRADDYP
jgi:hypothetical protein